MVEQRPFKPLVGGSSPPAPTTIFPEENTFFLHANKPKFWRFVFRNKKHKSIIMGKWIPQLFRQ